MCVGGCSDNELSVSVRQMDMVRSITAACLHVIEMHGVDVLITRQKGEKHRVKSFPQLELDDLTSALVFLVFLFLYTSESDRKAALFNVTFRITIESEADLSAVEKNGETSVF